MNRSMRIIVLCVSTAVVAAAIVFLPGKPGQSAKNPVPERVVKLVRIAGAERKAGVTYPGRVKSVRRAELFFRVTGPVIERNLKYGQTVEKGDVLMRIDPRDYQREVDRLTQEVEMQKVQNSLAVTEFHRNRKLLESKAVSQSAFDSANTRKQASEAQLKMLEVSLKIAKDKLEDTVLTAPFHGTVSDLKIEQYEIAHANVPVVLLDDLREVEIKISVPGGNLPDTGIHHGRDFLGLQFDVTFPGRGNRVLRAAIYEFKPVASETSEMYEVALRMKVPDDFLVLPGMSAEVHGIPYFEKNRGKRLNVPFAAVFKRDGRESIWIYHPGTGKLERREVKIGTASGEDNVYIDGNLKAGELAVAAGGDWLSENDRIKILNPEVLHENP